MFEQISKKRILRIDESWSRTRRYQTGNYWWVPKGSNVFAEDKIENLNWDNTINIVKTLPDNAKLYFHKTSKFPRHKLELTSYKRKIKESAADYIVGNFRTTARATLTTTYKHAWESDTCIFITYLDNIDYDTFQVEHGLDLRLFKHYENYKMLTLDAEDEFYIEFLCGKHSIPIIFDKDFNNLVDNKLERLSIEEVKTLTELIKSNDKENINLALKLFAQFNLSADSLFSYLFLSIHNRSFTGISSVLYTNLKKQFNPNRYTWYNSILSFLKTNQPKDDHEKELITYLLKDYLVEARISVNTFMEFKNLGYELELEEMYNE